MPFLALRSYLPADHPDKGKEIGSEATPAAFLTTLLALTAEWRRVLAPHGSLAVELGDTYSGSGGAGGDYGEDGLRAEQQRFDGSKSRAYGTGAAARPARVGRDSARNGGNPATRATAPGWPLDKSLCLLPTLYPASLAYGRNLLTGQPVEPWRVRNQIVWHRPNPPVGALGDKVRPSTSYVTVACTARNRWFDLDAERTEHKADPANYTGNGYTKGTPEGIPGNEAMPGNPAGAPPLDCWIDDEPDSDVWTIPTQPYAGAHYATFPIKLPRKLINLMCPQQVCTTCGKPKRRITERTTLGWSDCGHNTWRRGVVLDPFAGSGTTLVAASELGRDSIGIDIDARNLDLARQRCGMFLIEDEVPA